MHSTIVILCFKLFFIPVFTTADEPNFIDLSSIDFTVLKLVEDFKISFSSNKETFKIKCETCTDTTKEIQCTQDQVRQVEIDVIKGNIVIPLSFNILCDSNSTNYCQVYNIDHVSGDANISFSWSQSSDTIRNYLIYLFDSNGNYTKQVKNSEPSFVVRNLKGKSWYQICIASINNGNRTSKFTCSKTLTDFTSTGPVTNVHVSSTSDTISISWSLPQYKHDIPQAYIVHITGQSNLCYIIKMTAIYVKINEPCNDPIILTWPTLQNLKIINLTPGSQFNISITPFNRNKKAIETKLSTKIADGESGPVRDIKISMNSSHLLWIRFNQPNNSYGKIIKYRLQINSTQINICNEVNTMVHETYFTDTFISIKSDILKKCGPYLFTIFPINGWKKNGGVGKPHSSLYHHKIETDPKVKVDAKFISSNSVKVILKDVTNDVQCETSGFVIEITSEDYEQDCITRFVFNTDCANLREMVNKRLKCDKIRHLKFDKRSSNIDLSFIGIFRYRRKYKIKVLRIKNVIEEEASFNIASKDVEDCFTDCYFYEYHGYRSYRHYNGIQSVTADNEVCYYWKNVNDNQYRNEISNLCIMGDDSKPWCPYENRFRYCDIRQCSDIKSITGCVMYDDSESSTQSITVQWFSPIYNISIIGYLTLLYNIDYRCEQYNIQLCNGCPSETYFGNTLKNFYLPCKSGHTNHTIINRSYFKDLHQDREYLIFIIPIVNPSSYGEVKKIAIYTQLAKPDVPRNISIISASLYEIEMSWDKPMETNKYGNVDYYSISIQKSNNSISWIEKTNGVRIKIKYLEKCTQYCFIVRSENSVGSSEKSNKRCHFTLASRPMKVKLKNIISRYSTNQIIRWKYSTNNNCRVLFRIEYRIKFTTQISHITTTSLYGKLSNLKRNFIYTARVRSESQMETIDNEKIGQYSEIKEFYTGIEKPFISNYDEIIDEAKKTLNVKWKLTKEMKGSMFEFIIILKDSSIDCVYLIHAMCANCEDPLNHRYLSLDERILRNRLIKCIHKQNETFRVESVSFSFVADLENVLTNYSIDIHGVNLMGVHQLNGENLSITLDDGLPSSMMILISIIISLLFFLITMTLLILKREFVSNLIFKKKKEKIFDDISIESKENLKSANKENKSLFETINLKDTSSLVDIDQEPHFDLGNVNKAISVSEYFDYHQKVSQNGFASLVLEYKKLSNESKSLQKSLGLTMQAGNNSNHCKKNRFVNILPFDQNRVKVGDKGFPEDYINASYIPFTNDDDKVEYIASQGPIDQSLSVFWQMIWEQNINCIVMLTKTMEGDKFKCLQYWPDDIEKSISFGNENQFVVTLKLPKENDSFNERNFILENTEAHAKREIIQIHMHTWLDHSVPNLNQFDKLIFRFHELHSENAYHPYLVHCGAGVGRTGTFICIDRMIKELISGRQEINIYETVLTLSKYRDLIIQKPNQYVFIHDYVNHFLTKYMKITEGEDTVYFNEWKQAMKKQ